MTKKIHYSRNLKIYWNFVKKYKFLLVMILLVLIVMQSLSLVIPYLLKLLIDNGELFSQGSFKNTRDLTNQINNIDKGYIDTDNLELSIGDLNRFKNNLNIPNLRVYHVR